MFNSELLNPPNLLFAFRINDKQIFKQIKLDVDQFGNLYQNYPHFMHHFTNL